MKSIALLAVLVVAANAAAITWTGYGNDNQWTNPVNWNPDSVPGLQDDVTITAGVVLVTISTGVNSLSMGDSFSGVANLTIFQSFFIGTGGLQVMGNGNLIINSGTASITGSVTIGGNMIFLSGSISGQWTVNNRGMIDMSGGAQKALVGCQLSSAATSFVLSGVLAMNQSSQITVTTTLTMSNDVTLQVQDSSSVLVDTSAGTLAYLGGGTLQVQLPLNIGKFNYVGGNISFYDNVALSSSLTIPSGCLVQGVGSAVVNFTGGVSGSGLLVALGAALNLGTTSFTGAITAMSGNVVFESASSTLNILTISGGNLMAPMGVAITQLNLMSGSIVGSGWVTATKVYLNSQGFNLAGPLKVLTSASLGGLIAFQNGGALWFGPSSTTTAYTSVSFTGSAGNVTNNGVLTVANPIAFTGINLIGTGNVSATAKLSFQTSTVMQSWVTLAGQGILTGSNTMIGMIMAVRASPTVYATIGSYSFTCKMECDNLSTSAVPGNSFSFSA